MAVFLTDLTPSTAFPAEHHRRTSPGLNAFVFSTEMGVTFSGVKLKGKKRKKKKNKKAVAELELSADFP